MNIPLLDSERKIYNLTGQNTQEHGCTLTDEDDLEANQSQNSHQSSVEGEDDSSSEQEDFDNGSNGDSDVEFGYGEGDQLVEQQNSGEELTVKDQIMQCMQNVVQMQKSNDIQAALQYIEEAFHLMNYNTPSHWPTQYPEFFDDFGNLAMQNSQPTVAFTYYCIALDAPDSSDAEKSYEQIVNKVDEIDNHQLQEVYEQRKVLSECIQQQGFNWTNAIVNAYPEHIYNTCAIEGNRLGSEEVTNLMKTGIQSAEAVQMTGNHDVTEIIGAYNAYAYLFTDMDGQTLSVKQILSMHKIILENMPKGDFAGVFKNTMCISSEDYEAIMEEFVEWFQQVDDRAIDAISLAAMTHFVLVALHPFVDGNGRCARLLMNFVLMSHGFPPVVITMAKREAYYTALEIGHKGDLRPFIRFIAESTLDTMQDMVSNGLVEVDEAHHKGSVAGSSGSEIQKPRWKSEGDSYVLSNRSSLSFVHLKSSSHSTDSPTGSGAFVLSEDKQNSEVLIDWFKVYSLGLNFWKL